MHFPSPTCLEGIPPLQLFLSSTSHSQASCQHPHVIFGLNFPCPRLQGLQFDSCGKVLLEHVFCSSRSSSNNWLEECVFRYLFLSLADQSQEAWPEFFSDPLFLIPVVRVFHPHLLPRPFFQLGLFPEENPPTPWRVKKNSCSSLSPFSYHISPSIPSLPVTHAIPPLTASRNLCLKVGPFFFNPSTPSIFVANPRTPVVPPLQVFFQFHPAHLGSRFKTST